MCNYGPSSMFNTVTLLLRLLQLLGLAGRESYLFCDITRAYNELMQSSEDEGYSQEVIEGRRLLLESIKDETIHREGLVQQEKAVMVPTQLLPSAVMLLAQVLRSMESNHWN